MAAPTVAPRRSSLLVPVGLLLVAAGIALPEPLLRWAISLASDESRLAVAILSDATRLCGFAGIAAILIGVLRNRRQSRSREGIAAEGSGPGPD